MVVVFAILAVIFFVGRLKWKIATHAMIYFIEKKGYTQPTKEEMAECTDYVGKHMFGSFYKSEM